jgi:flagellar motility protein MotE (MotC chaperone)
MSKISTVHLMMASAAFSFVLIGMKSNDLARELILPVARAEPAPPAAVPATPPPVVAAPVSDEEKQLLQDLRARKQSIDDREKALAEREAALAAAEKRLDDRVQEMKTLQDNLQKLQDAADQKDGQNWKDLVTVYETMKPSSAAAILNNLDMPVLLQIFTRMQDRKAAQILSLMDTDRARLLTIELAKTRAVPASQNATNS